VVIDSYWIDPDRINALDRVIPTLAIIDNDARGIHAGLFLDQNLGAENREWPDGVRRRLLAGSRYALVRDTILAHRGSSAAVMGDRPRVVAFMGGTDPGNVMTSVAGSIARDAPEVDLVAITTSTQIDAVRAATSTMPSAVVSPPTTELPSLLGSADLVVSAAGTSAWDVCAMGKPAVLVAVVDNQVDSLAHAVAHGVALGLDGTLPDAAWEAGAMLAQLINDDRLREELTARSLRTFDGMGKHRVSEALEAMT
jgi:spore coat polysaccharide biosynthesis predicted glycosyltransferase SpsG